MCLKPTQFTAIYRDGLVQLEGHAFSVGNRHLVVHKERPALLVIDKTYKVSEADHGFGIPIDPTKNRLVAVASANTIVSGISDEEWQCRCDCADAARKTLKKVEG